MADDAQGAATGLMEAPETGEPPSPDTSGVPPARPPQAAPAVQPQAPPPVVHKPGVFDQVLTALGGGPKKTVSIDPQTGVRTVSETPPTRHESLMKMLAVAVEGAAAGLGASQGPGGLAKAGAAGVNRGVAQGDEWKNEPEKDAERDLQLKRQASEAQQRQQLMAAQTFETNQQAILHARQAYNLGQDARDKLVANGQAQVAELEKAEKTLNVPLIGRHDLTESQLLAEHGQEGATHATTHGHIITGQAPAIDPKTGKPALDDQGNPKMEYTVTELLNPHQQIPVDSTSLDEAVKNGYRVPGYTPGSASGIQMSVNDALKIHQYNAGVNNFHSLVDSINTALGRPDSEDLNADQIIQKTPQLGSALSQLASHWDGTPSTLGKALENMQASKDPAMAQAARTVTTAIGGDRLDEYNEAIKNKAESSKIANEEATKLPFELEKEGRLLGKQLDAEDRKQLQKDIGTSGYVQGPDGKVYYTNKAQAAQAGLPFEEEKPGDINKDKQAMRQLNDVQLNTSRYTKAAQTYADPNAAITYHGKPVSAQNPVLGMGGAGMSWVTGITDPKAMRQRDQDNLASLMAKAGWADLNASISSGGHIEIPVVSALGEKLSKQINSGLYNQLSDQAKDLYDGFVRTMASIPAYQKALTGIGRSNKEMLDLELANIANPTMAAQDIVRKQAQFQENIDRAADGFPQNLPGVSHPSRVRKDIEGPAQAQPNNNDPLQLRQHVQ